MGSKSNRKLFNDPERTTSLGMLRYATEYYAAALIADEELGSESGYETYAPMPVNFLIGHAIELALKAYVLEKGATHDSLFKLGHDLEGCLENAEKLGFGSVLVVGDDDRAVLRVLNNLYSSKQFEYSVTGSKYFPVFGMVQDFTERLLLAVVGVVPLGEHLLRSKAGSRLKGSIVFAQSEEQRRGL